MGVTPFDGTAKFNSCKDALADEAVIRFQRSAARANGFRHISLARR